MEKNVVNGISQRREMKGWFYEDHESKTGA
jgi:hypothetical protein